MPSKKTLIVGLLFGLAGFTGNWFKFTLFLNIDFLFGSFIVMIALLRFGTGSGVIASVIASSYTLLMWKHPYAMVIFILETVVVGLLNSKRSRADILLHDIAYWMFIGTPLVWLFYGLQMGDTHSSVLLIALKQSLNGMCNALLAQVLYLSLQAREKSSENMPLVRQVVFTVLVTVILIPAFINIFSNLRSLSAMHSDQLAIQTERAMETSRAAVDEWLTDNLQTVTSLVARIGNPDRMSPQQMQAIVDYFNDASTAFIRMGVFDRNATTVAFSPRVDENGNSTVGINFADRPYVNELKKNGKPYINGVLVSKLGNKAPVVPLVSPFIVNGEFNGYCSGVLRTDAMLHILKIIVGSLDMNITIVDQFNQIVVSTSKDNPTQKPFIRSPGWSENRITPDVAHWVPPHVKGKNLMQRWEQSWYGAEKEISPESHWKVIVENSYAPMLSELRSSAVTSLSQLVALTLLIVPVSYLLSRRLTRSLEFLRNVTISLRDNINAEFPESYPKSSISELSELIGNIRISQAVLKQQHLDMLQANDRLKESESRLLLALTAGNMAAWNWNIQSGEVVWNDEHFRMLGYEPGEVVPSYDAWAERVHPDEIDRVKATIQHCMQSNEVYTAQFRTLWPDGTIRWLEARGGFSYDAAGMPLCCFGVMRDTTDQKQQEEAMKSTEELLSRAKSEWERTFDAVPDLIAILDSQHRIMRVNRSMADHLKLEPKECIGLLCHEAIHGSECPPEICTHALTISDNKMHQIELHEESLGGDFLISTTPLTDASGKLIGSVHVARDISDRVRAENALIKAHAELEQRVRERTTQLEETVEILRQEVLDRIRAEESLKIESEERVKAVEILREQEKFLILQSRHAAMGEMIGNIAHQWRQPLNVIALLIQQIQMFYESGKCDAAYIEGSVRKGMEIVQHMSSTIDDFRNFFRPEKEQILFSVDETIGKAISLVRDSFANSMISIDFATDNSLMIKGFPNEFSQVILNILINARDALLERRITDPKVSITVRKENGKGCIIIADNAGGISDEFITRIFDPYFTTKGVQQGTGLGLYMAKTIIEKNMHGLLTVMNGAEGAEFRIEVSGDVDVK